jgi:two-component system, sensor histidine kinase and response regulator
MTTTNKGIILIADDVPMNLSVLMEFLESTGYKVLVATDGISAIEQAEYAKPDIILLDVMMPGIDGFETCARLKASEVTRDIPVIFMTALSETVDKVRGFELGAADYITKPLQQEEVLARVNAHLTLYRQKQEIQYLRQQDQLHYEQLVSIKDEILSTASHDLKNPLAAIMLSANLLRHYTPSSDTRTHKHLDIIQTEAVFMRELIINLLDLAKLEMGMGVQKQIVSLKDLLESSVSRAQSAAEQKQILLQLLLPENDITVNCDPSQIDQVVQKESALKCGQIHP